ncbi:MAG: hypothetical protein JL50_04500 [Peptococcaceae bacterium BICA1-7]|nr:MAG: hypothetical protein JL50_04500 [Peptococcaceae bacterium BICA1-7]
MLSPIVGTSSVSVGRRYLALIDDKEVGFLYIDYLETEKYRNSICLYKIFVLPEYRNIGIGKILLQRTEELCKLSGREKILLNVHPLDGVTQKEKLVKWYLENGYKYAEEDDILMEKII